MIWDKSKIRNLLETNNKAVERAILAIYHRQTLEEQFTQTTKRLNGVGFSASHARIGTYYARYVLKGNQLNGKHLELARKVALRYTGQLLKIATEK